MSNGRPETWSESALKNIELSSEDWARLTGVRPLDPDGWDRSKFEESWAQEITIKEFLSRACHSTCTGQVNQRISELYQLIEPIALVTENPNESNT